MVKMKMGMDIEWTEINEDVIRGIRLGRDESSDKRAFGHALLIVGSKGMMGAAVLSAGAALRSGCGLVTVHIPVVERQIVQIANPAAIVDPDSGESFSEVPASLHHYTSVGAGCGMGQSDAAAEALSDLFSRLSGRKADPDIQAHTRDSARNMPGLVLDADALNMIAAHPGLAAAIPPGSILTPHTRELSRLMLCLYPELDLDFAGWKYPWTGPRLDCVMALADRLSSVIVVKGRRTLICPPDMSAYGAGSGRPVPGVSAELSDAGLPRVRRLYVNTTGNAGMAKGGSGDVLTGLVTGLRARGYSPLNAAVLGVWSHGRAGDEAARLRGEESMCASDIIDNIRL